MRPSVGRRVGDRDTAHGCSILLRGRKGLRAVVARSAGFQVGEADDDVRLLESDREAAEAAVARAIEAMALEVVGRAAAGVAEPACDTSKGPRGIPRGQAARDWICPV